jgi:AraC-like DNA-binding protein
VQLSKKEMEAEQLTEMETQAAYAAEKIISSDLRKHFRIPELSRKVHLNEFRFKIVFKKIFCKGAYEYLQEKRMHKAKELLESGESVKVVASETGYRITHFITAFREHFGFTPGSIKRNKH